MGSQKETSRRRSKDIISRRVGQMSSFFATDADDHESGGIRGIIELAILQTIEDRVGHGLPIQELFDVVVGTSTGRCCIVPATTRMSLTISRRSYSTRDLQEELDRKASHRALREVGQEGFFNALPPEAHIMDIRQSSSTYGWTTAVQLPLQK